MALIGCILLVAASSSSLAGLVVGLGRPGAGRSLRCCQAITVGASVAAFGLLTVLVARGDPRVAYAVAHRVAEGAPWGYRLAAVWGGQAGGLLLWCVELGLVALLVDPRREARAVAVLLGIQGALLGLVALSNPFAAPAPGAGGGLNPLLQDPMMLIHPPLLFLGYALLAIPYAVTLGALIDGSPHKWPQCVGPWIMIAWLGLTAGNGFGASWAYKTFGWGGFWAWDPVENTSFVPWMLAAATAHSLWLARRSPRWLPWAAACAMASFVTVLYGSFLVRSGFLSGASVHAYVAGEGLFKLALGVLLAATTALGAVMLMIRWRSWQSSVGPSRGDESVVPLAGGARLLVLIAGLVLLGLSLASLSHSPGTSAYNAVLLPLTLALMVMLGWQLVAPHGGSQCAAIAVWGGISALAGLAVWLAASAHIRGGVLRVMPVIIAPLLLLVCVVVAVLAVRQLIGTGDRAWTLQGAPVAHLGVAVLLVGVLVSGYGSRSAQTYMAVGQEESIAGQRLRVRAVTRGAPGVVRAELSFDGVQGVVEIVHHPRFNIKLRRAWINRRPWGDVYITPLDILVAREDSGTQRLVSGGLFQVTVKPAMPLVWLGIVLVAIGIALTSIRRTVRASNGA